MRNAYTILVGKPEGRAHLGDLGKDGKIMKSLLFNKQGVKV
jgi:hypothetical protein